MALSPEEQRRYRDYLFGPGGPHPMTFNYPGDPAPYEPGYTPTGTPSSTNDLVGADNGLFAPGLVRGDPNSEDAVTRWNIAHLLMAPATGGALAAPAAPTAPGVSGGPDDSAARRAAIAWALMAQQSPGGMQGVAGYGLGDPAAPDTATTATPAADTSDTSTPSTTTSTDISVQAAPTPAQQDAEHGPPAVAAPPAVAPAVAVAPAPDVGPTTDTGEPATPADVGQNANPHGGITSTFSGFSPALANPPMSQADKNAIDEQADVNAPMSQADKNAIDEQADTPAVAPPSGLTLGMETVGVPGQDAPGPIGFGTNTSVSATPSGVPGSATVSSPATAATAAGQVSGFGTGVVGAPGNVSMGYGTPTGVPGLTGQTDAVTAVATPTIGPPAPPAPPAAPAPVGLDQATVNSIAANAAMHAAVQLGQVSVDSHGIPDKGVPTDLALAMNPVTVMADPTTVTPSTVSVADSPNTTASIGFADAGPLGGFGFGAGGYAPGIAGVAGPDGGFSDGTTGSDGSGGFGGVGQGVGIGGLGSAGGVSSGADSGGYGPGPAGTPGVSIGAPGQGTADGFGAGATATSGVATSGNLGGGYGISGPGDAAGLAAAAAAAAAASAE